MVEVSTAVKKQKKQAKKMDPNQKQQVVERLKTANNVLITVSSNPNVDQLAACLGFTLLMNKLGKHATAVFSGAIPSTLEFLQPEKTIETNTDSLRDFIIALDKSKADKLRYKVEDEVVRIFITPYKTSLSEKDLDFSQGDFNVDAVLAIGVLNKEAIDQAIVAHGRILHDATVMTVANGPTPSDVGSINWHDPSASSLSEMLVSITESFGSGLLDAQMATSFLTGIVAETERFSNNKTSPKVMTMSAQLMAAGANQQLIATKLAPPPEHAPIAVQNSPQNSDDGAILPPPTDGSIEIVHEQMPPLFEQPEEPANEDEINIDEHGNLQRQEELRLAAEEAAKSDADAAAAAQLDPLDQPVLGMPSSAPAPQEQSYLAGDSHKVLAPLPNQVIDPLADFAPQQNNSLPPLDLPPVDAAEAAAPEPDQPTVTDSPDMSALDGARSAVNTAALDSAPRPQANQAVGAQFVPLNTPESLPTFEPIAPSQPDTAPTMPAFDPSPSMPAVGDVLQQQASLIDPIAPPPVPPPMMPMGPPQVEQHHAYLNPTDQPTPDAPVQL